jgi:NAD(P)-dependent dehydrogenase (short-subunit alcohol dehydrogenase family)
LSARPCHVIVAGKINGEATVKEFRGKVAVVTGAGSGIGLGMARTFGREGMKVAMLDVRRDALEAAAEDVRGLQIDAIAIETDVSDAKSVEAAAARIEVEFGRVDIVCNNAGVLVHDKAIADIPPAEWDWILGVNLNGVINGVRAFLPRIQRHGDGGHIVNTASIGGFQVGAAMRTPAYAVSKFAVVALTEGLRNDLVGTNIGVSILAPAAVDTGIYRSQLHKPVKFGGPAEGPDPTPDVLRAGARPDQIGRRVLDAIKHDDFYIFTHIETRDWLLKRHQAIIDGYAALERFEAEVERIPRMGSHPELPK